MSSAQQYNQGFTLIELLLYLAIVGSLLVSITYFFAMTAEARVKNQSASEVNDQAMAAMDYITQTIRNATSITSPAAGASAASLTLVVPTGSLSPTIFDSSGSGAQLGSNVGTGTPDTSDNNNINATKFVAPATGTLSTLFAFVSSPVSASPNNVAQMAIYSGTTSPTTLLASSASTALTAGAWNTFSISPVSITSGQTYWLAYNTNGLTITSNELISNAGTTGQSIYAPQTFGTWPASWTGTPQNVQFSAYGLITAAGSAGSLQVKEGAAAVIPLTSNDVQVTNLTFKNLTKTGTAGILQVSFTMARNNPGGRNEYDFQKTFTTSAELTW
jgi:prepilin-type N-terminal cleavage/methylation domain-containing protein